jgi:hypothetical protein
MATARRYRCNRAELYVLVAAGIRSYREHITVFGGFKGRYDGAYAARLEAMLEDVMAMPGHQQRDMRTEEAGLRLAAHAKDCLAHWQALKRYIRDVKAWKHEQKARLEGAGMKVYARARGGARLPVLQLMHEGGLFIAEFETALKADGNMPEGFRASFEGAGEDFVALCGELMDGLQDNPQLARDKVVAENALYDELMRMFADGRHLFKQRPEVARRFTVRRVLAMVRGE